MESHIKAYVLTRLAFDSKGNIVSRNVGVTFSLFAAEDHRAKGVENEVETFLVDTDWREDAETSALVRAIRDFRSMVQEMHDAALR